LQPRLLLDTHVLLRALFEGRKLSRTQKKVLEGAGLRAEPLALSAFTLVEIAVLYADGRVELDDGLDAFLNEIQGNPLFRVMPITFGVASDVAALRHLKDPADRVIVATARVNNLKLVTSDQRIIDSNVVSVIE
jgi:PIN domain nuclease of toxin-antitoxin system